jgi:hypothetical protein
MAAGDGYYSVAAKNLMLDALGAVAVYVSAHTADPGSTGANECSGSVRQSVTWATAASGSKTQTNAPIITGIAIADAVQFLGLQSALTGGTYYGKIEVTPASASGGSTWSYETAAGTMDLAQVASA